MVGISENAIVQYETGRASPRNKNFQALVEALGVSAGYLLTGNDPEETAKAQTRPELDALQIMREIRPERQAALVEALRALARALDDSK